MLAVVPIPVDGMVWDAWQDALHALGFAGFAFLLVRCAATTEGGDANHRRRRLVIALGVLLALAVVTEGAQYVTPRDSDLKDFGRDLVGISMGFGAALAWIVRSRRVRLIGATVAVTAGVMSIAPATRVSIHTIERVRAHPVVHDFTHGWESDYYNVKGGHAKQVRVEDPEPRQVLRVVLRSGRWPAVIFNDLPRGWSEDETLAIDIENPTDETVALAIRLDDRADLLDYSDRFQRRVSIRPGWQTIRVPLAEVDPAVEGRTFRADRIRSITLFALDPEDPVTLHIDSIRLERAHHPGERR